MLAYTDVLITVMQKVMPDSNTGEAQRYVKTIRRNIDYFTQEYTFTLDLSRVSSFLNDIETHFVCSLFKDAKPTNWVFQANTVSMIDFDYVVPSFFLADLAQLLKLQYRDAQYRGETLLEQFLRGNLGKISLTELERYKRIFPIIIVNSSIAALRSNPHLSQEVRQRLLEEIRFHLTHMERGGVYVR